MECAGRAVAATALSDDRKSLQSDASLACESGVALRFPPQSKTPPKPPWSASSLKARIFAVKSRLRPFATNFHLVVLNICLSKRVLASADTAIEFPQRSFSLEMQSQRHVRKFVSPISFGSDFR
jgi:hypothetical protein